MFQASKLLQSHVRKVKIEDKFCKCPMEEKVQNKCDSCGKSFFRAEQDEEAHSRRSHRLRMYVNLLLKHFFF